jgi:hypothetical protein
MNTSACHRRHRPGPLALRLVSFGAISLAAFPALGQVATVPTMDPSALKLALQPSGLTITSVSIHNGVAGQFGTFTNFELLPVTIRPGIVLSSGDVTDLRPIPGATQPGYDPSSPPPQVNNQMNPEPITGATPEFDAFGFIAGNIENFSGSYDVAALRVDFTLDSASPIKFDFLFGSVEFPFYTSSFTDSFLVFLDGTDPANQITLDLAGNAVQVGSSFAGLETTGDQNSAFSNPHAVIHHLTTTSPMLADGEHFLIFEVGDVNDHILDSAVFIANLRAQAGPPGTHETEDPPYVGCPHITVQPVSASACTSGSAPFSVSATGDPPLTYKWQIRLASETWADLGVNPISLPCGGSAVATQPNASSTQISITPCPGITTYRLRCKVSNDCGDLQSNEFLYTVCYANCDCSTIAPILNVNDFACFLNTFAAGNPLANCDGSTLPPVLNVNDFQCFLNKYAEGCP